MANYRDSEPITPSTPEYNINKVPVEARKYSTFVREKMYGVDVREAVARGLDLTSILAKEAKEESSGTLATIEMNKQQINKRLDNLIEGIEQPSEVVDARQDLAGVVHSVLSARLNSDATKSKNKSTNRFRVQDVIEMDYQDLGVLDYKQIAETQTACLLNVSSEDVNAPIYLEVLKEVSYSPGLDGLVFAKVGEGERFSYSRIEV
ncbi:alpha-amylase [Listeria monocytogenes]|uniref:hypothetical protein n=1 Tax=Listeria monocytogenes TaxID=1639 RepID=UPI00086E3078|nr:hypothetical protein [Listeria monocytogenes]EAE5023155.1 alpha-amylase [Listeria monocytogenes]EAG6737999.1 alpha-amylase [Listeria monocytogenes]EED2333572.1 alpha-amylase [Listeria monocytogenes]OEP00541.1 hypothetical protein AJZ92_04340 [Listeria monocytogenes]HAA9732566.1 alpha-amylase [Listeria monocytogenes]